VQTRCKISRRSAGGAYRFRGEKINKTAVKHKSAPKVFASGRTNKQHKKANIYRVVQKTDSQFYFGDNFGNSAPILTILSLLQAEIYVA